MSDERDLAPAALETPAQPRRLWALRPGHEALAIARTYDNSVFINCPFDAEYKLLFEAVLFCVYNCGFFPRCSLEVEDGSQVRIDRITEIIEQCRLAVHDISTAEIDDGTGQPRLNMSLELGIFLGAKRFGNDDQRRKAAMILDVAPDRYQKTVSDIAGHDICVHSGSPGQAIRQVRKFLASQSPAEVIVPGAETIIARCEQFYGELPATCSELHLDEDDLTYTDLTRLMLGWLKSYSFEPGSARTQAGRGVEKVTTGIDDVRHNHRP
jgi:hypothetical protein